MQEPKLTRVRLAEEDHAQLQQVMNRRRGELEIRGGGPSPLAGALREVISRRRIGRNLESRELSDLWRSVIPADIANRTRVLSLRHRVLIVEVSDSVLISELASFHQRQILAELQRLRPEMAIGSLKFKLNARLASGDT